MDTMDMMDTNDTLGTLDSDDQQRGTILSRREVVGLFGGFGAALLAACTPAPSASSGAGVTASASQSASNGLAQSANSANAVGATQAAQTAQLTAALGANPAASAQVSDLPACVVRPEVTEGPYYVAENLIRSDIRSDPSTGLVKEGAPLQFTFAVTQVANGACTPLQDTLVEVWHCDAAGVYSDVSDPSFNTRGQQWLRGGLYTDANGLATFTSIYPGWYHGRAVHIHFKIHPNPNQVFTSQLFFDDALSAQVFSQAPYASKGRQDTPNNRDGIFQPQLLLATQRTPQGYAATFPIGVDLSTLGTGQSKDGPGGRGGFGRFSPPSVQ